MAFVEQPMAIAQLMPLRKCSRVSRRAGVRSSHTASTMRRPQAALMRRWAASTAGMALAPGRLMPQASARPIIVAAVPMVMQVPWLRTMPASTSCHCAAVMRPARFSSQYFQASVPEPSAWPRHCPRTIGPAGRKTKGSPMLSAPITSPGVVLSQPPMSTAPSTGWLRSSSSVSMASRLR